MSAALTSTVREPEATQEDEPKPDGSAEREIAERDAKLRQHRTALEAGTDPVLVTSWMNETQSKRAPAKARLKRPTGRRRMTRDEITSPVKAIGDMTQVRPGGRGRDLRPTRPDADVPSKR